MCVAKGTIVETIYGTGPYTIVDVFGPCNCARPSDELGYTQTGMHLESPDHYHFWLNKAENLKDNGYALNGYIETNGVLRSIWGQGDLKVIGLKAGTQYELFKL